MHTQEFLLLWTLVHCCVSAFPRETFLSDSLRSNGFSVWFHFSCPSIEISLNLKPSQQSSVHTFFSSSLSSEESTCHPGSRSIQAFYLKDANTHIYTHSHTHTHIYTQRETHAHTTQRHTHIHTLKHTHAHERAHTNTSLIKYCQSQISSLTLEQVVALSVS